jgi:glycosyltransferase involved in cell wall biosynthesis
MKIFIIHHHLNPGGVTRIIQSQISSLRNNYPKLQLVLLTGEVSEPEFYERNSVPVITNENLNYLTKKDISGAEGYDLLNSLIAFFKEHIMPEDIIHVHNMNLGKNPVMTLALSMLAETGQLLFNHSHDFVEDRPENMKFVQHVIEMLFGRDERNVLYPGYSNYYYGVLNSFDKKRLQKMGIDEERITLLPNPVHFEKTSKLTKPKAKEKICKELELDQDKMIITYPVRVIRRKNFGELALFSALFDKKAHWLVTQAPKNPVEIEPYQEWKHFCHESNINIMFEAGTKADFEELLLATDVCITTSMREGFGMVFLEPWLLGTPVMGRNISYVTEDLAESGIRFPMLYDKILVETHGEEKDFGSLTQEEQMELLTEVVKKDELKKKITSRNPDLKKVFQQVPDDIKDHNKKVISEQYSLKSYSKKLYDIYKQMA